LETISDREEYYENYNFGESDYFSNCFGDIGGHALFAQPVLDFKRVTVNWPTVELYPDFFCNGTKVYPGDKNLIRIRENGIEITDFTLWCPDPTIKCDMSLGLVFDGSSRMMNGSPTGNETEKTFGHQLVKGLDGKLDEACIYSYNDTF